MDFRKLYLLRILLGLILLLLFIFLALGGGGKAVYGADGFATYCTPIMLKGSIESIGQNSKGDIFNLVWRPDARNESLIDLYFIKLEIWPPAFYRDRYLIRQIIIQNPGCRLGDRWLHTLLSPRELFLPQ